MAAADVTYSINGKDFATFGVYVSNSSGVVCKPAVKDLLSDNWNFAHGTVYDLSSVCYKETEIQLKCFIEAKGYDQYITRALGFLSEFSDAEEHPLVVTTGTVSKTFNVLSKDLIDISKSWNPSKFVGTFTIKLTVPHPSRPSGSWSGSGTVEPGDVAYSIDGNMFADYGVYVSGSTGITTVPKIKDPLTYNWGSVDGLDYHQDGVRYQERTIQLKCFMEAVSYADLIARSLAFFSLFIANRPLRLKIAAGTKPLVYEVICKDSISLDPDLSHGEKCVGTFTIKLVEPEPVKRVLSGGGTATITIQSKTPVNIYWGDGSHTYDVSGNNVQASLSHSSGSEIIITGEPNDFTNFSSNKTTIWSRLL
jgi:hypothetical protein